MTGYDLADVIRQWLHHEGHDLHSVAEVILLDARFQDLRHHVGKANVFVSHLQLESFFVAGENRPDAKAKVTATLTILEMAFGPKASEGHPKISGPLFFWLDYFCLRQLCRDFEPQKIVQLVAEIPVFGMCIDKHGEYLKRSFCVLEAYAAVAGRADVYIATMKSTCVCTPVVVALAAAVWRPQ